MKFSTLLLVFTISLQAQISTDGLVGYWPLNGDADEFFNGFNNGQVLGASSAEDRCGNKNAAYYFDGIDDRIICGVEDMGIADEVSLSCWIKKQNAGTDIAISKYSRDVGYNMQFGHNGSAQIRGRDGNVNFNESGNDNVSICDDEWHHLVGIVDRSVWKIYIDTVLVGTYDSGHTLVDIGGSANPLTFGRRAYFEETLSTWNYYEGSLDEIYIYNRAISHAEVKALFLNECAYVSTLNDLDQFFEFEVFPNPTNTGALKFRSSEKVHNVSLVNIYGQTVRDYLSLDTYEAVLDLSELVAGTYFVHLETDLGNLTRKIIVF